MSNSQKKDIVINLNDIKSNKMDDNLSYLNSPLDFFLKRSISTNTNIPKNSILLNYDKDFRIKRNCKIAKTNKPITLTPFQVSELKKSSDKDKVKIKIKMNKLEFFKEDHIESETKYSNMISPNKKKEGTFDYNFPSIYDTFLSKPSKNKNICENSLTTNYQLSKRKITIESINDFLSKELNIKKSNLSPNKTSSTSNKIEKTNYLTSPSNNKLVRKINYKESIRNKHESISVGKLKLGKSNNKLFNDTNER